MSTRSASGLLSIQGPIDKYACLALLLTMIVSFADKDTESLAQHIRVAKFVNFERVALRKLAQLDVASKLDDLKVPPGNRLEALKGDRDGQHSIRINDQMRICFNWTDNGPENVEIVDYH